MNDHNAFKAMLDQGYAQLREGQFEAAIESFSACHVLEATDDHPLRGRGLAYMRLNQPIKAVDDFKLARELNKNEPENWMGLGVSLAMQNKIYEAITIYEELIQVKPEFVTAYLQLGLLNLKIGAIKKGREHLNKAMTLRPSLEQRKTIESLLKEQTKLDTGRYYRPDFDQLRKDQEKQGSLLAGFFKGLFGGSKKKEIKSASELAGSSRV